MILRFEVGYELADVASQPLDLAVLLLVEVVNADVHALASLRKVGLDLLGDEEIVEIGIFIEQKERAVDRVVIRKGHVGHPAFLGEAIDLLGRVVAVPGVGFFGST
jgi:hypothetical protein